MPPVDDGFAELSRFSVGDAQVLDTVDRIARLAVDTIEPAAYAGVTMFVDGELSTRVFTDPAAPEIDQAQYDTGEGPCLDSLRAGEVFRVVSTREDGAWPAFRAACRDHGILSTVSLPMLVDDVPQGALNLYSHDEDAFGDDDVDVASAFAVQAGVVVAYARSYWNAREVIEHLRSAMESRGAIEQAKGIIIATTGVSPDAAFRLLVEQSQHENRKLREVAVDLVNSKVRRAT